MTSFGEIALWCPECAKVLRGVTLASLNSYGWVQYTDGYHYGRLYTPSHQIRGCECGAVFLEYEVTRRNIPPSKRPQPRLFDFLRKKQIPPQPDEPVATRPDPMELGGLADQLALERRHPALELEIRLWRYWRGNDARRNERRPLQDAENAERLLHLLGTRRRGVLWLVRGQILRDLGRFEEAAEVYAAADIDPERRAWLKQLVETRSDEVSVIPDPAAPAA